MLVRTSYKFPFNSFSPPLLDGVNPNINCVLPFHFGNFVDKSLKFKLNTPFGGKFLNKFIISPPLSIKSTSTLVAANELYCTSKSMFKSENDGITISLACITSVIDG